MPGKNIVKIYRPNAFYHIYNRGVEKRKIFLEKKDYEKFLKSLKESLLKSKVTLLCFCLLPNHFHLLVWQNESRSIVKLMRSLLTKHSIYFNSKYDRVGRLFQGTYRARPIDSDADLLNVSAYIHNNPRKDNPRINLETHRYSSFYTYLGLKEETWIDTSIIKTHFIVEDYKNYVDRMGDFEVDLGLSL